MFLDESGHRGLSAIDRSDSVVVPAGVIAEVTSDVDEARSRRWWGRSGRAGEVLSSGLRRNHSVGRGVLGVVDAFGRRHAAGAATLGPAVRSRLSLRYQAVGIATSHEGETGWEG